MRPTSRLRELLKFGDPLVLPGIYDAHSAQLATAAAAPPMGSHKEDDK